MAVRGQDALAFRIIDPEGNGTSITNGSAELASGFLATRNVLDTAPVWRARRREGATHGVAVHAIGDVAERESRLKRLQDRAVELLDRGAGRGVVVGAISRRGRPTACP